MRTLEREGVDVFLEIGPHPVLIGMGRPCVDRPSAAWLPTLRRGQDDWTVLLDALGALFVRGVPIDWRAFDAPYARRHVAAPTYPFQRRRYWAPAAATAPTHHRPHHPLLGERREPAPAPGEIAFENTITGARDGVLADHRFLGEALLPASGTIEMACAAGAALFDARQAQIEGLVFHRRLAFGTAARRVRTVLRPTPSGDHAFEVHSRPAADDGTTAPAWTLHAAGTLRHDMEAEVPGRRDLDLLRRRMPETVPVDSLVRGLCGARDLFRAVAACRGGAVARRGRGARADPPARCGGRGIWLLVAPGLVGRLRPDARGGDAGERRPLAAGAHRQCSRAPPAEQRRGMGARGGAARRCRRRADGGPAPAGR